MKAAASLLTLLTALAFAPAAVARERANVPAGVWKLLAECESGADWRYNGPSGHDGAFQFHPSTWAAHRLSGYPRFAWQATPRQQVRVARRVLAAQGWAAWPTCSRKLGLR